MSQENTKMKFCPELFDAMSNAWHSGRDGDVGGFMEITKKAMISASEEKPVVGGPTRNWICLYHPSDKILMIKIIRTVLGNGLVEGKHMADCHTITATAEQYARIMSDYLASSTNARNVLSGS